MLASQAFSDFSMKLGKIGIMDYSLEKQQYSYHIWVEEFRIRQLNVLFFLLYLLLENFVSH